MEAIWTEVEKAGFKVSTDTRRDVTGVVFFCLKGENFDGNTFALEALEKGALAVVTEDESLEGKPQIYVVENVLDTLHQIARKYRETFDIPVIAIGGSNGKTTSRELMRDVLRQKYQVHSSEGNLNNHIGVPLSILSMDRDSEIAVFEIGANHQGEHLELLDILNPTHVVVTNNGLDHLEGFGSPTGVREANKELYTWASDHDADAFVDETQADLVEDSEGLERIMYTGKSGKTYTTKLFGKYNLPNIELALAVGKYFGVKESLAKEAIANYSPTLKRSQTLDKNGVHYIVDCYNANPSSMMLALDSFLDSAQSPRGVILGDMLELGSYAKPEHKRVVEYLEDKNLDLHVFVGPHFKNALDGTSLKHHWFENSDEAKKWFAGENFEGYTILLKASKGTDVGKVIDLSNFNH